MHISYTAHNSKSSTSCSNLIEYLDKENQIKNNTDEVKKIEYFFNSEYDSVNSENEISTTDIINELDNNRGSQKLSSSNYYMMNVSPSFYELKHMENIAIQELNKRGIREDEVDKLQNLYFNEQKNELMKMQLKLYTKDIMTEYAKSFNREIFVDESKLPSDAENKQLKETTEKLYAKYLEENNIILNDKKVKSVSENKDYVTLNNVKIIEDKGKSLIIEIDLKEKGKANVFVPKSTLHLQKDESFKMPKNLYEEKEKEVIAKNNFVEVDYNFSDKKSVVLNKEDVTVFEFELKDSRFSEKLKLSINEKDLKIVGNKYLISEHLLNEKKTKSFENAVEKEFGNAKDKIYQDLAKSKGFDLSKRPLEEKDLLWYGKVENNRAYKHTDKSVKFNKDILLEIKQINSSKDLDLSVKTSRIKSLEEKLIKDKFSKEIIKEGNLKGGNQYHVHVVVSRHDKTMKNSRNKISLSPLANAVDSKMQNGAKVGFNRKEFAEKAEKVFDSKFEYDRPNEQTFKAYNQKSKENINAISGTAKNEAKQFIMKHTGLNEIKQEISPVQAIKSELGIANIPTKLPVSVAQVAIKAIKKIIEQTQGY
ncbi:MAG: hypothetical protein HC854_14395 [Flavobacterium sp.]|nr:hypothetical protein [Flavobacterium sp.]